MPLGSKSIPLRILLFFCQNQNKATTPPITRISTMRHDPNRSEKHRARVLMWCALAIFAAGFLIALMLAWYWAAMAMARDLYPQHS